MHAYLFALPKYVVVYATYPYFIKADAQKIRHLLKVYMVVITHLVYHNED